MKQWEFIFELKVVDIMLNASHLRLIPINPPITQTRSHNNEIRKEGKVFAIKQRTLYDDVQQEFLR